MRAFLAAALLLLSSAANALITVNEGLPTTKDAVYIGTTTPQLLLNGGTFYAGTVPNVSMAASSNVVVGNCVLYATGSVTCLGVNLSTAGAGPFVLRTGDTMTGQLTNTSSITVQGGGGLAVTYGVTAGSFTVQGSTFQVANGAVTIGAGTPSIGVATLLVNSLVTAALALRVDSGPVKINNGSLSDLRFDDGSNSDRFWIGTDANGFAVNDRTGAGAEIFRWKNGGNVGVGTASPTTKLSVYGIITSSTTQGSISCSGGTGVLTASCTDSSCLYAAGVGATNCTYTFGTAWNKTPVCVCGTDAAVPIAVSATATTNTIKCTASAALTGDNVSFICTGAP